MPRTVPLADEDAIALAGGGEVSAAAYTASEVNLALELTLAEDDAGQYYHIAGEVQANPGRPLQPRTGVLLEPPAGETVRGAILWEGWYSDTDPFDPSITRPVTDVTLPEPTFLHADWYPNKFWSLNKLATGEPKLVVVAGQYRSRNETQGVERVFPQLTFYVFSSSSSDVTPPGILQVTSEGFAGTFLIQAEVWDLDEGVQDVWCTYEDRAGHWATVPLAYNAESGLWEAEVTSALDEFGFFIQAADGAGNVSVSSNKGGYYDAAPLKTYLPAVLYEYTR
jgi:hypothetical protein